MKHSEAGRAFASIAGACFLSTLLAAQFLPAIASAADLENSTGKPAAGQPQDASRWTVSTEAIVLDRTGGVSRTLVERVPGDAPFYDTYFVHGPEALNSSDFGQGFSAGPKIGLIYHGDSGYGLELSYFNVFDRSGTKSIGPDNPADWLVMRAPGGFWQTQDFPYQTMAWKDTTSLYSAEANGRLTLSSRLTVLVGFRWLQLNDSLLGTLTPPDRTEPLWKNSCNYTNCQLSLITEGDTPAGNYPPFWKTDVVNNLYGFQIGVDGKIWEFGRFSLGGQAKIGLFDDNAWQSAGVSVRKTVYSASATADNAAFAAEGGLQLKYQVTGQLALKTGYELLWLDGIALAPGQIKETVTTSTPSTASVHMLGVNSGSNVLFQGFTAGLEYSF